MRFDTLGSAEQAAYLALIQLARTRDYRTDAQAADEALAEARESTGKSRLCGSREIRDRLRASWVPLCDLVRERKEAKPSNSTREQYTTSVKRRLTRLVRSLISACDYRATSSGSAVQRTDVCWGRPVRVGYSSRNVVDVWGTTAILKAHHEYVTTLDLPWSWRRRVYDALGGRPVVDGELVLWLEPTDTEEIFVADVLRQRPRGFGVYGAQIVVRLERASRVATRVRSRTRYERSISLSTSTSPTGWVFGGGPDRFERDVCID